MAKFVWYVVDLDSESVSGTNDTELVKALKDVMEQGEGNFIFIHKDSGVYFNEDSEPYSDGEEITETDPSEYDLEQEVDEDEDTPDED